MPETCKFDMCMSAKMIVMADQPSKFLVCLDCFSAF